MKAIIDTHALIWAVDDPARLGSQARAIVEDSTNEILFSSGSIWGIGHQDRPWQIKAVTSISEVDESSR